MRNVFGGRMTRARGRAKKEGETSTNLILLRKWMSRMMLVVLTKCCLPWMLMLALKRRQAAAAAVVSSERVEVLKVFGLQHHLRRLAEERAGWRSMIWFDVKPSQRAESKQSALWCNLPRYAQVESNCVIAPSVLGCHLGYALAAK